MLRSLTMLLISGLLAASFLGAGIRPQIALAAEPPPPDLEIHTPLPPIPDELLAGPDDELIPPETLFWQDVPLAPELAPSVLSITTGFYHTCAVLAGSGRVLCWGANWYGQLGDGTYEPRLYPVEVSGLRSGALAVSAGHYHTCAITAGGGVICWGSNYNGQLGDGTTNDQATPVDASGLGSGVVALAAGAYHTCALTSTGGVRCWGKNEFGQLGNGGGSNSLTPVNVSGLSSGVRAISAGTAHTCAVTDTGAALCWGKNAHGQLGNDSTNHRPTPVAVSGLSANVLSLVTGDYHTCAVVGTGSGGVKCWGNNSYGQTGDGVRGGFHTTPVDVIGLSSGFTGVAAGEGFSCALGATGVWCWGYNGYGQLGNASNITHKTPVQVLGLQTGVTAISAHASSLHICAIMASPPGGARCWGMNADGELGVGINSIRPFAAPVASLAGPSRTISAGGEHTCTLQPGGAPMCWGKNRNGQLGTGNLVDRFMPAPVSGFSGSVTHLAVGREHTCALTTAGVAKCWGSNDEGQLGDGSTVIRRTLPVDVALLGDAVTSISAGAYHTCATVLTTWPPSLGGALYCWGLNDYGALGDGSTTDSNLPVAVSSLSGGVTAAAAGYYHTCALTASGGVKCWGSNGGGQLGDGTTTNRYTPVDVTGLGSGVVALAVGNFHTCALTTASGVKCWGDNTFGELGDGSFDSSPVALDVLGMTSGIIAIAAGEATTCAIDSAGGVFCWGANYTGQVGDGSTGEVRPRPTRVLNLPTGAISISAGSFGACAGFTTGMQCWGGNYYGELGVGTAGYSPTPVDVSWLTYRVYMPVAGK